MLVWSTAEGFGGPYTSGASDIGTAVVYALVFAPKDWQIRAVPGAVTPCV
jgi:hypothetical protein